MTIAAAAGLVLIFSPFVVIAVWGTIVQLGAYHEKHEQQRRALEESAQVQLWASPYWQDALDRLHKRRMEDREMTLKESLIAIPQYGALAPARVVEEYASVMPYLKPPASKTGESEQEQAPVIREFPPLPLTQVVEELPQNQLIFAFGTYRTTGELVQTTLPDALHIQVTGATGQGKSVGAQGLITQLAATNDTEHLAFGFLDPEGDTCIPFHSLPHVAAMATNADQAAKELHRMRLLLDSRPIGPQCALLIFIEEFLSLQRMMSKHYREQALDDFTEIALRGRRRYMYLLVLGQTAYREKDLRDAQRQFQSVLTYALHPDAVRAAGMTGNNEALRQLWRERRKGQFLLQSPGQFGDQLVLAPHTTATQIATILGGSQVENERFPVTSLVVPASPTPCPGKQGGKRSELDSRTLALVRDLVSQQKGQNEIIQVAFPNMRNAEAVAEYRRYLSCLVLKEETSD